MKFTREMLEFFKPDPKDDVPKFRVEEIHVRSINKVTSSQERPSESYIEIILNKGSSLSYIMFQNYYTYSIKIKQLILKPGNDENIFEVDKFHKDLRWRTLLNNYRLMKNAHFEGDAQNSHIIKTDQFNSKYKPKQLRYLRIYLTQPSPNWYRLPLFYPFAYLFPD